MMRTRVIPVLLLRNQGLVKTVKFKDPKYIGDPINSIRIFNEKEVDELIFLDISATPAGRGPNFDVIEDITGEAFMPVAYGGGVTTLSQAERAFGLGIEKIVLNTVTYDSPDVVRSIADKYGRQAVVGSLDARRTMLGRYELTSESGRRKRRVKLEAHLDSLIEMGVGEVLVNSIDRDGSQAGYDLDLLKLVSDRVEVPVVACGGAGCLQDFQRAINDGGCSAVAAGSMFVFNGKHRAVLISYPERAQLKELLP